MMVVQMIRNLMVSNIVDIEMYIMYEYNQLHFVQWPIFGKK